MLDLVAKQRVLEARLRELITAYQQFQAQANGTQQEILKLQGRLELLTELQQEEAKRASVPDGDFPRLGGGAGIIPERTTRPPGPPGQPA